MQFADLEAFCHVARRESFSAAAAALRIAQSALSRRVARLERQLGFKLLVRHGRGVSMTPQGAALLASAEGLMERLAGIGEDIRSIASEPVGRVIVAFTPTAGQILGPRLLIDTARHSRLEIEIREGFSGSVHDWIQSGSVDVGLLYDPEPSEHLEITPLLHEPLVLVGAAADIDAMPDGPFPVERLGDLPLVLPPRSHSVRRIVEKAAAQAGTRLNLRNQVDGMRTICGIVEAGLGFTVTSYVGIYEETRAGKIKYKPLDPGLSWKFSLVSRKRHRNAAAIEVVRRAIVASVQSLAESGLWHGRMLLIPQSERGTRSARRTALK